MFTPVQILKSRKHLKALLPDVKELKVRLYLVLGLLPQFHLFLLPLAESGERILVVKVCLFPKHPQERSLALFSLIFPILLIDCLQCLLGNSIDELFWGFLSKPCDQVIFRLALTKEDNLLEDVNYLFEVTLGEIQKA